MVRVEVRQEEQRLEAVRVPGALPERVHDEGRSREAADAPDARHGGGVARLAGSLEHAVPDRPLPAHARLAGAVAAHFCQIDAGC